MNKKILWGVLAVIVIGALWLANDKSGSNVYKDTLNYLGDSSKATPSAMMTAKPGATKTVTTKPKTSTAPSSMSYTDALKAYAGRIIQFDSSCQAHPVAATFKSGTSVMLDNRSSSARTVSIDGTSYSLAANGFRIITLSSASLPRTLQVNCGSSVNVMNLLLQAKILQ
jgi:hypothetical protein